LFWFKENVMKIIDIVKGNRAKFSHYRCGNMHYDVIDSSGKAICTFPVDVTNHRDIGSATFCDEHKAINLMRYIRKAMEDGTLEMI
jgi:hypothetical protein